ncbi:hypothetical protein V1477_001913 [Vespula maculifrons]|uniref:Uncharacterized protein n=1 Tax=Vespula maculifrons TaxID=7453 RepID=A0ABD2CXL4_VESMC
MRIIHTESIVLIKSLVFGMILMKRRRKEKKIKKKKEVPIRFVLLEELILLKYAPEMSEISIGLLFRSTDGACYWLRTVWIAQEGGFNNISGAKRCLKISCDRIHLTEGVGIVGQSLDILCRRRISVRKLPLKDRVINGYPTSYNKFIVSADVFHLSHVSSLTFNTTI